MVRPFFVPDLRPVSGRTLQIARAGNVRPPTEVEALGILRGALYTLSAFRSVLAGEYGGRQVILIGKNHGEADA